MQIETRDWLGKVMTINGLIPADDMGITLPHEHLIVKGWDYQERNYLNSASMELTKYINCGGKTIVEASSIGLPRDAGFFASLSKRTGVQVIMGTGFYKSACVPADVLSLSENELTQIITQEIFSGVSGTKFRAGVIGEVGVSRKISPFEEKSLVASARAQKSTGAAILVHFDIGASSIEYHYALDILEGAGASLSRVIICHLISRPDNLDLCLELAQRGCFLEFDLFGQERSSWMGDMMHTHPQVQISSIKGFLEFGLLNHILISQNVNHVDLFTVNSGDGYAHILMNVVPKLRTYSLTEDEIHTIMVTNPQKVFPFYIS